MRQFSIIGILLLVVLMAGAGCRHELAPQQDYDLRIYAMTSGALDGFWKNESSEAVTFEARPWTRPTEAFVYSVSNDNSQYHLFARVEPVPYPPEGRLLAVGPGLFSVCNYGGSKGRVEYVDVALTRFEANMLAEDLGLAIADREPLSLVIELVPTQEVFVLGKPMPVDVRLTNAGPVDLRYSRPISTAFPKGYDNSDLSFYLQDGSGQIGYKRRVKMGPNSRYLRIDAGQSEVRRVDLTEWLEFSEPGTYTIGGRYATRARRLDYKDCFRTDALHPKTATGIWDTVLRDRFVVEVVAAEPAGGVGESR